MLNFIMLALLVIVFVGGEWKRRNGTLVLTTRAEEKQAAEDYLQKGSTDA